MEARLQFIDTRQSNMNKSINLIYYLVQKDKPLPKFVSQVNLSQYLKRGEQMGYLEFKDGAKINIAAAEAGVVTEIKQIPKTTKDSKIHLFSIKICQHFPKTKNQSQSTNSSSKQQDDVCMHCQKLLQYYYQSEEKQVKFHELKKQFQNFDISEFQWSVVLNQQFTKGTQICVVGDQAFFLPETGKITFMYQFQNSDNQWVDPQTVVIKYKKIVCKHEKITNTQCLICLTRIEDLKKTNFKRYLFQLDENPNLVIFLQGRALAYQVKEFKERMLKRKKALLVLDLDNTILHSISLRRVTQVMMSSLDEYVIIPSGQTNPLLIQKTLVKFRPNFQYFLSQIVPLYEIFIYTKGTRQYAVQICKAIREKYHKILEKTKNFKPYRIISRDQDPFITKKDLQYMVPQKRDFMLILDDRRDVWNHSPLCIFTKPYIFFYYVAITEDGKTKIQPVEWEKGGGTLKHQLNKFQQNCLKKIDQAQQSGHQEIVKQKIKQLQQQVMHSPKEVIIGTQQSPQLLQNEINNQKIKKSQKQQETKNENIIQKKVEKFDASEQEKGKELKHKGTIIDQFLITTAFALKQTHIIYFNKLQMNDDQQRKQGKYANLGHCFQEYRKGILDHLSAYFAFRDYKKSAVFRRAQKLGLKIIQNPQEHIDLIIRPNNFREGFTQGSEVLAKKYISIFTNKVKSISQLKKVPVVSQTWIDTCYEFSCCLEYTNFEPSNPLAQIIMNSEIQMQRVVGEATNSAAMKIKQIMDNQNANPEPAVVE